MKTYRLSLEERMADFQFCIDVFYEDVAAIKDDKLRNIVLGILRYISISGSDTFTTKIPDVINLFYGNVPLEIFGAYSNGRKFLRNGKPFKFSGGTSFVRHVLSNEDKTYLTIEFQPDFVAYLVGGFPAVEALYKGKM